MLLNESLRIFTCSYCVPLILDFDLNQMGVSYSKNDYYLLPLILGSMVSYDYGILTDTNVMPITKLNLGGQTSPGASATATVGDVRCGPRPFGRSTIGL